VRELLPQLKYSLNLNLLVGWASPTYFNVQFFNKQQTTNNKQPTTNNQQPTTNNKQQITMWKDEILEEIHKYREEHAKSFNYDPKAIFKDLNSKPLPSGMKMISKPLTKANEIENPQ